MALSDFKKYVASKGGGAEQYVDPNTGKIKTEATGGSLGASGTPGTNSPAGDVGGIAGLKNPAPIAPGLGMVNSNSNAGKSAWEAAKDKTSQGVAESTKQEYISYLDRQEAKPTGEVSGGGLRAPGLSMNSPTDKSVWEQSKDEASGNAADAAGKDYVPYAGQTQPAKDSVTVSGHVTAPQTPTSAADGSLPSPNGNSTGTGAPGATPPTTAGGAQPGYTEVPQYGIGGGGAGGDNTPGAAGTSLPTATDMSDYINEYYAIAEERAKNAAEEAYLSAMEAIDAEAAKVPQYYYEAGRQQTGQNALERKAMNERLAASGLNTGAAGQAALAQSAVNQNAMAQIRQAEADAMAAVESRRREVAIEYEAKVRDAVLSGDMARAQALFAEAQRVDESIVNVAMQQAQLDIQQQQLDMQAEKTAYSNAYQKAQDAEARATEKAKMLASVGDFSGYRALGYTDDEIAVLKGYWDAENATPTYSGGGSPTVGIAGGVSGSSVAAPIMGAQAQSLYGAVSKGLMDAESALYVLEAGLANGTIPEAEANYILSYLGL